MTIYEEWTNLLKRQRRIEQETKLSEAEQSRLRVLLAKKAISKESYLFALEGMLTVDEADALGYEDYESLLARVPEDKKEQRRVSRSATRVPRACLCGCEGMTGGGKFCQGHDAKLKSLFKKGLITDPTSEQVAWAKKHRLPIPEPEAAEVAS